MRKDWLLLRTLGHVGGFLPRATLEGKNFKKKPNKGRQDPLSIQGLWNMESLKPWNYLVPIDGALFSKTTTSRRSESLQRANSFSQSQPSFSQTSQTSQRTQSPRSPIFKSSWDRPSHQMNKWSQPQASPSESSVESHNQG